MTKMNKKGTSLVELIAVIVIMGIIAAIAVPTTIGVINRQKKNAAKASAEAIVAALKNRAVEEMTATTVVVYTDSTIGSGTDAKMYVDNTGGSIPASLQKSDPKCEALGIDNAKIEAGYLKVTFTVSTGAYQFEVDTTNGFKVAGYKVTAVAADGTVTLG